ncbi:MAG TPA: histidinol phosphate phosphatase [Peptococcaceae bacterium]|nr:MAG: Histidinol phosphate phosphatase HisJ family [Clostridia bacterium 41_269]HBT20121.1 histidinol phosphate phosphatase [Peptococcaceae bacterium]
MFFCDYHVHCSYSADAEGSIEEYCLKAVEKGIRELCFTPHYEADPVRRSIDGFVRINGRLAPVTGNWLDDYFREIEIARKRFADRLIIKAGIEMDHIPEMEKDLRQVVGSYPFDFVLGAVHSIDHTAISSASESFIYFSKHSASEMLRDYYSILEEAVASGIYNALAHLDVYKRFGLKYYSREELEKLPKEAERAVKEAVKRGIAFEINTSGYRQGPGEPFPGKKLLKYCVDQGARFFTVGSDAHRIEDLGRDISKAVELLEDLGGLKPVRYRRGVLEY